MHGFDIAEMQRIRPFFLLKWAKIGIFWHILMNRGTFETDFSSPFICYLQK